MFREEHVSKSSLEKFKTAKTLLLSVAENCAICSFPGGMQRAKITSSSSSKRLSRSVQWNKSVFSSKIGQAPINSSNFSTNLSQSFCVITWFIQFVTISFGCSVFRVGSRVILAIDWMIRFSNCKGPPGDIGCFFVFYFGYLFIEIKSCESTKLILLIATRSSNLTRIDFGRKSQGTKGLVKIVQSRIHIHKHQSFTVAAQGMLK